MATILIPLAVATIVGLIQLWPAHADRHINHDLVANASKGMILVDGSVTATKPVSCGGDDPALTAPDTPSAPKQSCEALTVRVTSGPDRHHVTHVMVDDTVTAAGVGKGTGIIMSRIHVPGQTPAYNYADTQRGLPLGLLAAAFGLVVLAVARWRGLIALLGLAFGGAVLILFALPAMVSGSSPLLVGVIASLAIVFVVLYATHGFSSRTSTALLGTIGGLGIAAILAQVTTRATHLTGAVSDNDFTLHQSAPDLHLSGVVVCGMVIAGLGVLNDITITQASAVWELAEAGVRGRAQLYRRAMRIGRDHVASAVYTIAFVWAGASLSTLLLIAVYDRPLLQTAQNEIIAADIVSTLAGATALVLAMPLTTLIAISVIGRTDQADEGLNGTVSPEDLSSAAEAERDSSSASAS